MPIATIRRWPRRLAAATGAPVLAFGDARAGRSPHMEALAAAGLVGGGEGVDPALRPTGGWPTARRSGAGWQLTALHTPGHFGNHLSFRFGRTLFSVAIWRWAGPRP